MIDNNFTRSDVFEIFPSKIGSYIFPHEHETRLKQLCLDIIDKSQTKSQSYECHHGYLKHYFDPINSNNELLVDTPGFENFHKWIKMCSVDYINNTLGCNSGDDVIITQCWINECSKGGFQTPHDHKNSLISGTYFVNFVPEMHAPLKFLKSCDTNKPYLELESLPPLPQAFGRTPYSDDSETSVKQYEGQLLLWQSHIAHSYHSNNADKRISISFNVLPKTLPGLYNFKITRI